jgi:hypothetical protein
MKGLFSRAPAPVYCPCFLVFYSPIIFTSTRFLLPPSNSP